MFERRIDNQILGVKGLSILIAILLDNVLDIIGNELQVKHIWEFKG